MRFIERRVMAQYTLASTVINYAADHSAELLETVHGSRKRMALSGQIYDESRLFVLEHGRGQTGSIRVPNINVPCGRVTDDALEVFYDEHTTALKCRTRPTAYIIERGTENEAEILRVLSVHAAPYYELPVGSTVKVRQYLKADNEIVLADESPICFDKGAYVFPNTVPSTILSVVMEPDFNASSGRKMTLLSMGLIVPDDLGALPVYRYCHDLEDGKVKTEV
jgi:hypothetical protein